MRRLGGKQNLPGKFFTQIAVADKNGVIPMFDVIEVNPDTGKVRLMTDEPKKASTAEAIERMALMRRGDGTNFFDTVPTGKYADGDTYNE